MTTIEFGGGPTIDQRRDFAGLKEGSHVPGYGGYCPHLKYSVGKTYGEDTHQLSTKYDSLTPRGPLGYRPKVVLKNELPKSTGDNKLTEKMVPGYTGYIPRMPFKFGDTYKVDCDVCIDDHMTNVNKQAKHEHDMRMTIRAFPQLKPWNRDPLVRDHLNTYRDTHPPRPILSATRRGTTEPPMPGFSGFIPRIYTTETGLGCRYQQMCKNGLELFKSEGDYHSKMMKQPIIINESPSGVRSTYIPRGYSKRVYLQDGMIPKYTGYVPQRRFMFGNTYGDTTRSLDVCDHTMDTYGEYIKTPRIPEASNKRVPVACQV